MQRLNPSRSSPAQAVVHAVAQEIRSQATTVNVRMSRRLSQIYGDLTGQRAVSEKVIADYSGSRTTTTPHELVMGLEFFFSATCHIVAAAALTQDRERFLRELIASPSTRFVRKISTILDGRFHLEEGHRSFGSTLETRMLGEASLEKLADQIRALIILIVAEMKEGRFDTLDPLQALHNAVFPSNLCHVTGQFYTPPWLARFVLRSVAWKPGETLIDPFCGSGVFLLVALEEALERGAPLAEVVPSLIGIDLSPTAVCASKTNLLLSYIRHVGKRAADLPINILCADSLAPTISKGLQLGEGLFATRTFCLNGEIIPQSMAPAPETVAAVLTDGGQDLSKWGVARSEAIIDRFWSTEDRQLVEQIATYKIGASDVVATNPPWVGWEYISKNYRQQLNPAWSVYDLFEQKGLKAAFLKEDLSTLCVPAAMDAYLVSGGRAGLVLRQSTMKSDLAGRGVRRLSIYKNRDPLELTQIHDLGKLKVFEGASAPAAVWIVNKGKPTQFPVPVSSWTSSTLRSIAANSQLSEVLASVEFTKEFCRPVSDANPEGRWTFDRSAKADPLAVLKGSNDFKPRIGFFTGGANAVYYLAGVKDQSQRFSTYKNITERAKRKAPGISVQLENDLVYSVIRGRDISYWHAKSDVFVLCPHNEITKMRPIEHSTMERDFPKSMKYLTDMRYLLDQRNGFAGWEKKTQNDYFYSIQRIGSYTFSPYKVCWSYISDDFVVAVSGSDENGKAILPNDKVVFIPAATRAEAYFVAGLLSFNVIRSSVIASATGRQISANVIRPYALPQYNPDNESHNHISELCESGHLAVLCGDFVKAKTIYADLNASCGLLLGVPAELISEAERVIADKLGFYPFKTGRME